ncbi:phosphatase PAP2 family protein [Dermacoccus sp. PAMC28757]|uniref:phosphatase PAP2 family protein n=1 Tax=Dermacoccus sp. PAMC28757 TaxID=2762331 RepID=UPI00164DD332|nr:phosphatase PAP2 family protein [Dermacoccus sp. PAMC28757]QNK52592.1 phosphatase PAP2 family protein [Dermacoccus sp. PAMC28757]
MTPPTEQRRTRVAEEASRVAGGVRTLSEALARLLQPEAHRFGLVGADIVPLLVLLVCAVVLFVGLAGGAEVYEGVRERGDLARFDQPVLDWAVSHRSGRLDSAITAFTHLGGPVYFPIILVLLLAVFTWLRRTASPFLVLALGLGSALAFTAAGKDITARSRPPRALAVPPYESSPSFPSGHTVTATVTAVLVAYLVFLTAHSRRVRTVAVVLCSLWALLMGLSRVFLGHHWLTDVMAGWCLGLAWGALVIVVNTARLLLRTRHRRLDDAGDTPVAG